MAWRMEGPRPTGLDLLASLSGRKSVAILQMLRPQQHGSPVLRPCHCDCVTQTFRACQAAKSTVRRLLPFPTTVRSCCLLEILEGLRAQRPDCGPPGRIMTHESGSNLRFDAGNAGPIRRALLLSCVPGVPVGLPGSSQHPWKMRDCGTAHH